ncbi:glycosyltransferase [uncultured Methanobrevibacter sp.]|uniref:glycosyltransferase n=1 Tax=uncultured Methanobrevibacter sp. TaxID=253161 RepID=UPI00261C6C0D|nr:glycosyltransferase [uncultured Methanobrevibacter sp.]
MNGNKNKTDLIDGWDESNISVWIDGLISSSTTRSEKIDVMKYIAPEVKNLDYESLCVKHKTLLDLIASGEYNSALKLCELLSFELPSKKDEIKNIIKDKNIYFLSPKLEIEMGGLGRTVLYRANFLAEEGYKITLLNIGPVKNYDFIKQFFKAQNLFSDNLEFINIYEYYSRKNTLGENKPTLTSDISDDIVHKENNDKSTTLSYFDESGQIRTETYIDGCLVYQQCEEFEKYFTKDGFNYLTHDKSDDSFTLKERSSNITCEFADQNKFLYHFLDEICLNEDKPFIICDSTSHWYDANGISTKDAYKIGSMHGSPFINFNPKNKISPKINHLQNFNSIHRLVILTNDLKNDLKDLYNPDKLVVIPNFVFEDNLEYGDVEKDLNKISMFSRISPEKQISEAIEAFEIVCRQNDDAVLEIYGGASNAYEQKEDDRLKKLVIDLKLEERVKFMGFSSDIRGPMQESLVMLLTSKHEGLPLSILEAMTNSTAVISYDCYYGPSELISDGVDGILIKQNDKQKLAESILKLLDNPELAIEMGKKGKEKIINHYTLSQIAPMWEELFIDIYVECEINDFIEEVEFKKQFDDALLENRKLKQFKSEILSSTSWKITKPLRRIMQIFRGK